MENTRQYPVNREMVFEVVEAFIESEAKVPSLPDIRSSFTTPTSPAIAVYFAEWREENKDKLVHLRGTVKEWKAYAERLVGELAEISTRYKDAANELHTLTSWLRANHLPILTQYNNHDVEEM